MSYWQLGPCKNIKFKYETLRGKDEKMPRIQQIDANNWLGWRHDDVMKDVKYLRAPEIFHLYPTSVTFPGPWCWPLGLDTQLTRTHWCQLDTSRNWFSALSPTSLLSNLKLSLSQSLFWDMFGFLTSDISLMFSLRCTPRVSVLGRMLTWVYGWLGCIKSHHDIIMSVYLQM